MSVTLGTSAGSGAQHCGASQLACVVTPYTTTYEMSCGTPRSLVAGLVPVVPVPAAVFVLALTHQLAEVRAEPLPAARLNDVPLSVTTTETEPPVEVSVTDTVAGLPPAWTFTPPPAHPG